MRSFRWRIALWFALSLFVVLVVFMGIAYSHLTTELRLEKWERDHPGHTDWTLHGSYSAAEVDDIAGELLEISLLYSLPVALLALALGYHLARRSLQPVAEINRQLQAIGARTLDHRVRLTDGGAEFRAIEQNLNALLGRLDENFRQLTEFSAQVAHELRTPLTLMRLQVEEAAGRVEPALAESMQEELRRLSDYVDQCLLLATAEQGRVKLRLEPVPLRALVTGMIEVYELLARTASRPFSVVAPEEVTVTADARFVRQMLHNLLTNALRHGTGEILVFVGRDGEASVCRVSNVCRAGASTPPFATGLGLRIVRALAGLHPRLALATGESGDRFVAELRWT